MGLRLSAVLTENGPFFLTVIVVILGALYSNRKITEIKEVILAEFAATRAELQRFHNDLQP